MKRWIVVMCCCCCTLLLAAQPLVTRNGYVGFFSKTPLEDIRAENRQVNAVIDPAKKNVAFALLMKSFLFGKELMQQHFNENYIESDKYPKGVFNGSYTGNVDLQKDGSYPVTVRGQLTLHGVTQTIEVPATMMVQNGKLVANSTFKLKPGDFNIKIPSLVREKIAPFIDVAVKVEYNLTK
jgi:polyisoprenoid-binding protein YceI